MKLYGLIFEKKKEEKEDDKEEVSLMVLVFLVYVKEGGNFEDGRRFDSSERITKICEFNNLSSS